MKRNTVKCDVLFILATKPFDFNAVFKNTVGNFRTLRLYTLVIHYSAFIFHSYIAWSYHNSVQYNTYSMSKTRLFVFWHIWD
jgi:hypothetical protein